MRCHSSSGQPSGLLFQKRLAPSRQRNGTIREGKRISASHAETKHGTGPEQDHSRSRSARSNSWAECRDKWDRHRANGGDFSLDIPFYRTLGVGVHVQTVGLNAETNGTGIEPMGEIFLLTFLFIGLFRRDGGIDSDGVIEHDVVASEAGFKIGLFREPVARDKNRKPVRVSDAKKCVEKFLAIIDQTVLMRVKMRRADPHRISAVNLSAKLQFCILRIDVSVSRPIVMKVAVLVDQARDLVF